MAGRQPAQEFDPVFDYHLDVVVYIAAAAMGLLIVDGTMSAQGEPHALAVAFVVGVAMVAGGAIGLLVWGVSFRVE